MKVIKSDWLNTQIAIFTNYEDYVKKSAKLKLIEVYDLQVGTRAFYQRCPDDEGFVYFLICFPEHPSYKTIVHETSHVTDMIFDYIGLEPCTETEAYFHSWLFGEVLEVIK